MTNAASEPKDKEHRCDCGAVLCRLTERGVEIKCRRCKRVVVIPLTPKAPRA
jgi:phage FluMu protein Com